MLARKIELLARTLQHPDTTKYQAEAAGKSLLELSRQVGRLEELVPEGLPDLEVESAPIQTAQDCAMEWLKERYSEEELEDVFVEEHDHDHKWRPVRKKVT